MAKCRIYQIKSEADSYLRFLSYKELREAGEKIPRMSNYKKVFDDEINTNNPESIFMKFMTQEVQGFTGHSMCPSDIIEVCTDKKSKFYYVDTYKFIPTDFEDDRHEKYEFQSIDVHGISAIFTTLTMEQDDIPKGLNCYNIKNSKSDWKKPESIKEFTVEQNPFRYIDHYGSILTKQKLDLQKYSEINEDSLEFSGMKTTIGEFIGDMHPMYTQRL